MISRAQITMTCFSRNSVEYKSGTDTWAPEIKITLKRQRTWCYWRELEIFLYSLRYFPKMELRKTNLWSSYTRYCTRGFPALNPVSYRGACSVQGAQAAPGCCADVARWVPGSRLRPVWPHGCTDGQSSCPGSPSQGGCAGGAGPPWCPSCSSCNLKSVSAE